MRACITPLEYWKSEHDANTNEDALAYNPKSGLFAVADGVGSASFANIWSHILVHRFLQEPLMSAHPFEVEWWLRRAQEEYSHNKDTRPESVPAFAQEKAREGSKSTLVTARFVQVAEESAQVVLLAIGDSNAFIVRNDTKEIEAFPLEKAEQFDTRPLILPTRLVEFDRDFQRCQTKIVTLHLGDILVLATDAVSKWVLSQASPRDALDKIISITQNHEREKTWQEFIESCRKENTMLDDDSTALVIQLADTADSDELGTTVSYSEPVLQEREIKFKEAQRANLKEWIAIYFGDGQALASRGIQEDHTIKGARLVADAVKELRRALSATVKTGDLTIAKRIWDKYSDTLQGEPSAKTLIESLKKLNIPLEGPMLPESPKPVPTGQPESPRQLAKELLDKFRMIVEKCGSKIRTGQDAESIRNAYNERFKAFLLSAEQDLVSTAQNILTMRDTVREAIRKEDEDTIRREYKEGLDRPGLFKRDESNRIALACLRESLKEEDDDRIVEIADRVNPRTYLQDKLTKEEHRRLDVALKRNSRLRDFESAFHSNDDEEIVKAYDAILEGYKKFTPEYRQRYELARKRLDALNRFRQALQNGEDEKIVRAYVSDLEGYPKITWEERQRLEDSRKRVQALAGLREALQNKNVFALVKNADAVLLGSNVPEIHRNIEEIVQAFFTVGWLWRLLNCTAQNDKDALRGYIHDRALMDPEDMKRQCERLKHILEDPSYAHVLTDKQKELLADIIPIMTTEIERAMRSKKCPFRFPWQLFSY